MDSIAKSEFNVISKNDDSFFSKMKKMNIHAVDIISERLSGNVEDVFFRNEEYKIAIATLNCNRRNSLAVTGSSGVGKTTFIHYLSNYLPVFLPGFKFAEINVPSLMSDCSYRGEFEKKLTFLIESAINDHVIVYFDEAHSLSMTGGSGTGGIDAMNILKPHLTRGLRCIISTTIEESHHIKNDSAFTRRFRFIELGDISDEQRFYILRNKFKNNPLIESYISENDTSKKNLFELIDDVDFLISTNNIVWGFDEVHTK